MKPWRYKNKDFTEFDEKKYYGFVYSITNLVNGKIYYGRKYFWRMRRNKLRINNWHNYTGSSTELNRDIQELGIENFDRKILCLCTNKSWCKYKEMEYIIKSDALKPENKDKFYNKSLMIKISTRHLPKEK